MQDYSGCSLSCPWALSIATPAFDAISEIPLAHEDATITDPALATIFAETEGLQRGDELFARLPS